MNPVFSLIQLMKSGKDPRQAIQKMASQNPQFNQTLKLIQGKTPDQLRETAENMAKQRGIDLNNLANQLGVKLPK